MAEERKTKRDYFETLREMVVATVPDQAEQDEMLEFIDRELEILENRKAAAQKRAEKRRAESDALTDQIYSLLGDDWSTVDTIVESIDDEEVTRNKVTSRLGKLIKLGKVEKESIKVDGKSRMAYRKLDKEVA